MQKTVQVGQMPFILIRLVFRSEMRGIFALRQCARTDVERHFSEPSSTQQQQQVRTGLRFRLYTGCLSVELMWSARDAEDAGIAKRRRERRLRQFLRHERLTVAMLLAKIQHHAAPRGQNMARSRGEESELNNATGQKTPPPRATSTVYFSLDDHGDALAARPTPLAEVRPQQGSCGTPRSRSSRLSCPFKFSILQCRSWGTRWWGSCRSLGNQHGGF